MKKKNFFIVLVLILLCCLTFSTSYVRADSGWDYDYDSGSSWDNDWDSSSGWDDDYSPGSSWNDSNTSSGGNYKPSLTFIICIIGYMFILFIILIVGLVKLVPRKRTNIDYKRLNKSHIYEDMFTEEVEFKLGMTSNAFKNMVFDIYKNIQNAWTDFDYDSLRRYTTNELYNTYRMQLETLNIKKQKNIMTDIECIETKIFHIKETNGLLNVTLYMNVRMYDYVVDSKGKVIRGTDKRKVNVEYEITFVKSINSELNGVCPNCGAKINVVSSGKCDYCGSTVVIDSKEFVMSKKRCINQRME